MRKATCLSLLIVLLFIVQCDLLDIFEPVQERLNILQVKFAYDSSAMSLIYPSLSLPLKQRKAEHSRLGLEDFGINLHFVFDAKNDNDKRAVFDSTVFNLFVNDTVDTADKMQAAIPNLAFGPNSDTSFSITFPIRLDSPIFSSDVLYKIVDGSRIPYRITADMIFQLALAEGFSESKTITFDIITDSIATRPSQDQVNAFLSALSAFNFFD